jgi:hypothetical protein
VLPGHEGMDTVLPQTWEQLPHTGSPAVLFCFLGTGSCYVLGLQARATTPSFSLPGRVQEVDQDMMGL